MAASGGVVKASSGPEWDVHSKALLTLDANFQPHRSRVVIDASQRTKTGASERSQALRLLHALLHRAHLARFRCASERQLLDDSTLSCCECFRTQSHVPGSCLRTLARLGALFGVTAARDLRQVPSPRVVARVVNSWLRTAIDLSSFT